MKTISFESKKAAVTAVISASLNNEKVNRKEVAEKYGFSVRSLSRYIAEMKDQILAELKDESQKDETMETKLIETESPQVDKEIDDSAKQDNVKKEKPVKPKSDASKGPSKRELAEQIFNNMKGAARKDIIKQFIEKAGLTKAGAATYYYNLTKKAKDQA